MVGRDQLPESTADIYTDFLQTHGYCLELYYILIGVGTQVTIHAIEEDDGLDHRVGIVEPELK